MKGVRAFTLGDLLHENARRFPQRTAVVCEDERLTYPELRDRALRTAGALSALGVGEGDRVAWLAQNCHRYLETLFGCALLGAVVAPLNWRSSAAELEGLLDDLRPSVVLAQRREIGETVDRVRGAFTGAAAWVGVDDGDLDARRDAATAPSPPADVDDDAPVIEMFTAAFEGRPKGALLTHSGLLAQNLAQALALRLGADDCHLASGPFFHIAGFMFMFAHLHVGGRVVVVHRMDGATVARLVHEERVTGAMIMPPSVPDVVAAAKANGYDLSSLRVPAMSGTPELEEFTAMTSRLEGYPAGYGQTEVNGLVTLNMLALGALGAHGVTSPVAQVRIVGPDGEDVAPGETGEIAVRGPLVMSGYAGQAAEGSVLPGWRLCNDLGRREPDGTITFIGPKTELIKTGAENVYPTEVENALRSHPAVRDVCVIGVPDPAWGQSVKAVVECHPDRSVDAATLVAHCRELIASYKKPREVEFVGSLPRTPIGFVDRAAVRSGHGGGGEVGAGPRAATVS